MNIAEKLALMNNEFKEKVLEYLEGQKEITDAALRTYDETPIMDSEPEVKIMREREAIKLRQSSYDLAKHIAVIKKMK